jgi:hypothetical protein
MTMDQTKCMAKLMYNFLDKTIKDQPVVCLDPVTFIAKPVVGSYTCPPVQKSLAINICQDGYEKINTEKPQCL